MNPQSSTLQEKVCHISDEVHAKTRYLNDAVDVRQKVCGNLPTTKNTDGKHYCILHLPSQEKNEAEFNSVINERIAAIESEFIRIENNLDKYQKTEAKSKLKYDFRYVWFGKEINLSNRIFVVDVDFSDAAFIEGAFFSNSVFIAQSRFVGTKFKTARFNGTKFSSEANFLQASFEYSEFISTTFKIDAKTSFKQSKFTGPSSFYYTTFGDVDFSESKFSKEADFKSTTFLGEAKFDETSFSKMNETKFCKAKFEKDVFFDNTQFNNKTSFNSVVFDDESDVFFRKVYFDKYVSFKYCTAEGYLRFADVSFGEEARMSFNEAAFEKASRISFLRMSLRPSWFVRVDSRKMSFTDIKWIDLDKNLGNENLFAELKFLESIQEKNPKQVFRIAARQLAENSENNSNFEDASNFRRMAMETEWFEKKEQLKSNSKDKKMFLRKFRDIGIYALYRFSSSYGERWGRAFVILIIILTFFAFIYTQTNFYNYPKNRLISDSINECKMNDNHLVGCGNEGLPLKEAILHSLTTATFQNVDNRKPATFWAELWVMLEKIFAPLQAALLALAIRRKFMR